MTFTITIIGMFLIYIGIGVIFNTIFDFGNYPILELLFWPLLLVFEIILEVVELIRDIFDYF